MHGRVAFHVFLSKRLAVDRFSAHSRTMLHLRKSSVGYSVVLLILVIIAAWPFLSRHGLPLETDAELHVFRLAELARLVRGGELYPRWAPNFYFGYGYPIFNYYAPLAYYLGLPFALMPSVGAVVGVKFVFVLTFLAGAGGIFLFVSEHWGRAPGLISAAAYVFAPYLQYVDPHARGDVAEFLSFGLFPLALWSTARLYRRGHAASFLATVLTTSLVILSHNLMALVFFFLLTAWALWQISLGLFRQPERKVGFQARRAKPEKRNALTLMALILSVGISAFFWLPVALEQDAVNLSSLIGDGGHFDFRNHFLSLGELLGPTKWLDWGATEPEFALNLGMVQWLLALLGMAGLATGHARQRAQGAFFAVFAVGFILLMTRASLVIWATVPMMPFLQFPWRLLGPVAAILAILGGAGVQSLSNYLAKLARREPKNGAPKPAAGPVDKGRIVTRMKQWFPALVMLLVLVQSLPLSMVPPWPETPWDTSAPAVMEIERQGRWLGTTSTADFVPRTVEILPRPQEQMVDAFIAGGTLDRVNRATLPQGTAVKAERITPLHTRYQVSSEQPFFLRLFQFSFPGWQARIDGAVAETTIGRPEGFLVVPVPAGEHTVDISFVETTERRIAWLLSGVSAFAAIMLAALIRRTAGRGAREERAGANSKGSHTSSSAALTPFLLTSLLFLLVFALAHRQGWFYFRSTDWTAIPAEHDVFADLGDQVALIGYDAPEMAEPGDSIEVTLYWKAQQDVEINYQVFLHLLDSSGTPVTQSDKLNPGDFPTRRWPTDKYVRDTHRLKIPETITPGVYRLSTGLWVQSEGWRLPLFDRTGEQIGDSFVVAPIEVR